MADSSASVEHHDAVDRMLTLLRAAPESQFAPLTILARELLGTPDAAARLPDFQTALAVMGGIGLLVSLRFLTLPHDAGAEVSGAVTAGRLGAGR